MPPINLRVDRSLVILIVGFFIIFTHYSIRYNYGILLPEMLPSLAISKFEAGMIYTSYFIGYTLLSPFLGLMVDRFDARKIITLFLIILGLGTLLMGLSNTLMEASLSFALAGIGCAACWVPIIVVIQRWFKKKAFAVAIANAGAPLGFAITGIIMPSVINVGGWRFGWSFLSILSFLLVPISWLSIRNYPKNHLSKQNKEIANGSVKVAYSKIIKDLKFWLIGTSYLLVGFYIMIPFTFLSTYAFQEIVTPYAYATALVSMIAIGAIPGMLSLAAFSESFGRLKTMVLCGVISIITILGMALVFDFYTLAILAIIFGVPYGAVWPLYTACAFDMFSAEHVGKVLGLWTIFAGVGFMISPPIAGWIADITKTLRCSFLVAMFAAVLSLLFLLPIRRR